MIEIIKQFLIVCIIVFSLNMIFFYFKNKSKKFKNTFTSEMFFLVRIYGVDINRIGLFKVQKDISMINSIIITTDLLILYNVKQLLVAIIIIAIVTFVLIAIFYNVLGKKYVRMMYRG